MPPRRRPDGITICIPNWNHRNYLGRSVGSALAASKTLARKGVGCQILVVDDFSRDGSQRLLASMALLDETGCVDALLLTENKGLANARNLGLQNAKYTYVCFMDADNELIPENLYHFWRATQDTRATLIYGNLLVHDESRSQGLHSNDVLHAGIYEGNYIDAFSLINADEATAAGGYYGTHAPAHEDWEMLLHLVSEGKSIVFVPLLLGYYYVSSLSMIKTVDHFNHSKVWRMFSQRKSGFPVGYKARQIYHPDVGWL